MNLALSVFTPPTSKPLGDPIHGQFACVNCEDLGNATRGLGVPPMRSELNKAMKLV